MKKITFFLLVALVSLFAGKATAATISVNPGGDVAAALTACADGDIIELTASGDYVWNAQIDNLAKTFTIRAKAGLLERPHVVAGPKLNFGFTFARNQAAAGSAVQTFDGIWFDGAGLGGIPTTFFIVKDNLGFNTDVVINNCYFTGIVNATTPTNVTALTYSNSAPSPNPNNLTITNSVSDFNGQGFFAGSGKGRPKNITVTNCLFKGLYKKTLANSSASTDLVDLWVIDHCTFDGNNSIDVSLWGNVDLKNCIFSNSTSTGSGSTANAFGTGGNLMTKCGLFYAGAADKAFPAAVIDATTLLTDPKLDEQGFATAAEYVGAGTDGQSIGYYDNNNVTYLNTGINTPSVESATLSVIQNGNEFQVRGAQDAAYAVYSVTGKKVAEGVLSNGAMQMNAVRGGIYIIKTNNKVAKFAVK
ncbi:MAG: hypothetical protein PHV20_02090 [Bacteroidales bacterium]|nr:hypothetical protein [Bacteroidales bacterium]